MKERPILFSTEMVRAILDGRKTQTRRVVKPQPNKATENTREIRFELNSDVWHCLRFCHDHLQPHDEIIKCPYGVPGDRLWVRETWATDMELDDCRAAREDAMDSYDGLYYRAGEISPDTLCWRQPIHMPRWASRITLEVVSVRVERVQDISWEDAQAEGCWRSKNPATVSVEPPEFCVLWDSINAKRGFSWEMNPWCWVVEFKRLDTDK